MKFAKAFEHDGGQQQDRLKAEALAGLAVARNALPGIKDPVTRGALVAAAEAIVQEARDGGPWVPPPSSHEEYAPF